MVETIDNCVGCEICLASCQWHSPITVWTCDICDEDFTTEEDVRRFQKVKGKDICSCCMSLIEDGIIDFDGNEVIDDDE